MYYRFFCFVVAALIYTACIAQVQVAGLRSNRRAGPVGIGDLHPGLSWRLFAEGRNIIQTAYEVRVAEDSSGLIHGHHIKWRSGKVFSSQSVGVRYQGAALASGQYYFWQVRVWDGYGRVSGWSPIGCWQMGLLSASDWKAQWISPGYEEDPVTRPSPLLRREFTAKRALVQATLFITAHGLYEARINGVLAGNARLTPGWTEYDARLTYQAYDVTALLRQGRNAVGVVLGDGWYRGVFGPWNRPNNYGKDASLLCQLLIRYRDGSVDTIISDDHWKSSTGGIRYSDLYNGEIYDARMEPEAWTKSSFGDEQWTGVRIGSFDKSNLVASECEPVREHEHFAPARIFISPRGERILDFGQNLSGWVQCRLDGRAGDTIRLSHAEVLDSSGNFYTGNLREARAQDTYILNGKREEIFAPHFTVHGFRYVRIEGYTNSIRPDNFTAIALYSDLPATGHFHCSDSLVNRLQQNIVWSQQSNFVNLPTDCPQRSERLGWTGDAQLFTATAAFNKQVDGFYTQWLQDLRADQGIDGGMPNVVPDITDRTLHRSPGGVAGWGDAAVIMPWTLFGVYADTGLLAQSYPSMKAWVGHIHDLSQGGLWRGGGYGDWLAPPPVVKPGEDPMPVTPTDLGYISQCYYYYSCILLAKTAGVLGKPADSMRYRTLADTIRTAFLREYMTPDARAISNTQTAYVLALYTNILPPGMATRAAERLAALIHDNLDHLGTGFLGTPWLCPVLTRYGYTGLAYTLLEQTTPPSWLYPVTMGGTTIWEKWQALRPDRSIDVSSFNHYAYGAIGDWLYRDVAGISPGESGYKLIDIHPHIDSHLKWAAASYLCDYGLIRTSWTMEPGQLSMEADIPANTRATIWIPATHASDIYEDGKPLREVEGLVIQPAQDDCIVVTTGSGKYHFTVRR